MGLGLHGGGVGVVKFLAQQGAKILVTDLKTKKELKESIEKLKKYHAYRQAGKIKYILGKHRVRDFKNADLIIKNPGVPRNSEYLKIAKKNKIPIETDIGLFFELCPSKNIIGVTGTKGKSTAATLIYEILKTKYKTILAGNIRTSVLEELPKITKNTIVVLELSSWQLEDIEPHKISPHIAVITNIMQDHLNRYKGIRDYIKSKKIIFKFQKPDDILILNHDDKIVSKFARESKGRVIYYFKKQALRYSKYIHIRGEHNLKHISAALAVAKLFKVPSDLIKKTLINFKGIAGRLEFIREISGVKYYNDTTATTPEATIAALNSFPGKKIILIAGGTDKKLNFKELARIIHKKVKSLILLPGTATQKLISLRLASLRSGLVTHMAKNMKEAVKIASKMAERNDIVLLSPGCASFGLFKHEFDRGEQFQKCIKLLEEKI